MQRWTQARAQDWSQQRPWICGFNFLPSTAVNFLEMWHPDTFDPQTIERELGWAADIGFNAVRVNLPFLGWQNDRDRLIGQVDHFMTIAHRLGISTVLCLFDDCGFGGAEPVWGFQPDPVPGVHNSRAVASPGRASVMDPALRPALEAYVRGLVSVFRADTRILFWDLYNEPGNRMDFRKSEYSEYDRKLEAHALNLMESCFVWARSEQPSQPLTVAAWKTPAPGEAGEPYRGSIDQAALALSDIITFHAYANRADAERYARSLECYGRPLVCTEWMARSIDSRISDQLQMYQSAGIGCFQWGLVKGRTQTFLPWPDDLVRAHGGTPDRSIWFHDLLHENGEPYDPAEVDTIRRLTASPVSA